MKLITFLLLATSSICFADQNIPRSGCREATEVTLGDETKSIKEWEEIYCDHCYYADTVQKKMIRVECEPQIQDKKHHHHGHGSGASVNSTTHRALFFRCQTCGKVFKMAGAMQHADDTGHKVFDPIRY